MRKQQTGHKLVEPDLLDDFSGLEPGYGNSGWVCEHADPGVYCVFTLAQSRVEW
jgi:hypothetical protein